MTYRVQARDRALNVFAFHDEPTFDRAVDVAQQWAFLTGSTIPIEIIFHLAVEQDDQGTHEPIGEGVTT